MAEQHQHSSERSSSEYSQTLFTPSETFFTPSTVIRGLPQPSLHGEQDVSNSSQSGEIAPGQGHSVDGSGFIPNMFPASGNGPIDEPASQLEEGGYQNMWVATTEEQSEHYRDMWSNDTGAQFDPAYVPKYVNSTHQQDHLGDQERIRAHIADFEQSFGSVLQQHGSLPSTAAQELPDGFDPASYPWPSGFLAGGQLDQTPQTADLIYEPAVEIAPSNQYGPATTNLAYPMAGYPQDDYINQDTYLDKPTFEEALDPPHSPDPVGPPSQVLSERGRAFNKAPRVRSLRGRRHGPLDQRSRQNARSTREKGQCWNCTLKRDQCRFENDDDEICIDCKKMRGQSLLLKCVRVRLPDLIVFFVPASLAQQHDRERLRKFASDRIRRCLDDSRVTVYVTWGYFKPIKCNTVEIEPIGTSLLYQNQWRLNERGEYDLVQVPSPPLGMILMAVGEWRVRLNGYLEEMLQKSFHGFPKACFRGDDCCVAREFLIPIFEYQNAIEAGKAKSLVHQSLKLVVLTHIMTHSLSLVEDTKDNVRKQLKNPPREDFGHHTCPRWLNRQIKFLLSALHYALLKEVLHRIQDALRLSNNKPLWAALFASMVVLATITESQQVTVRCKEATDKQEGAIAQGDKTADEAIGRMDEQFLFLSNLFHQRFRTHLNKGFNPLIDIKCRTEELDGPSQLLAVKAADIVGDTTYRPFLIARQALEPPTTARYPQTARLLARFLLFFCPPKEQRPLQPAVPAI
ncbi:MAG: hypothetical protein Q9218_000021 [Villophora microphyllina]